MTDKAYYREVTGRFKLYDATGEQFATADDKDSAERIIKVLNAHDALVAALKGLVPRCRFTVNRDTGEECGEIATRIGSFNFTRCEAHPFKNSEGFPIDEAIAAKEALALAEHAAALKAAEQPANT